MMVVDLARRLAAQGIGTYGTDVFAGSLPATPESAVAVLEYAGAPALRAFGGTPAAATAMEDARVQVLVRSTGGYAGAQAKAQDVVDALDWTVSHTSTVSGVLYQHIAALQRPAFPLKIDETGRWHFVVNFAVRKARST
jgi:hypothetical protein